MHSENKNTWFEWFKQFENIVTKNKNISSKILEENCEKCKNEDRQVIEEQERNVKEKEVVEEDLKEKEVVEEQEVAEEKEDLNEKEVIEE
jgi:bacterioferritin-associated ferredoxin